MNKRNKIIVSIVGITIVLLALLGITYAYYLTRIQGNTNTNSISITTADLKLEYGDGTTQILTKESIIPDNDNPLGTKDFTVSNIGNTTIENYKVVLEYAVIDGVVPSIFKYPEDFEITLTCVSKNIETNEVSGTCSGTELRWNNESVEIVKNTIDAGIRHEYSLEIYYKDSGIDQSDDMGKNLNLKVQIYGETDTSTITGTISNVDETYAMKLNSEPKISTIKNVGTEDSPKYQYKFIGVEANTHTLTLVDKNNSTQSTGSITINKGTNATIDGSTITVKDNQTNIYLTTTGGSSTLTNSATFNPYSNNTDSLAYHIINNAMNNVDNENLSVYSDQEKSKHIKYNEIINYRKELSYNSIGNNNITYGTGYEYDKSTKKFKLTGVTTCSFESCYQELVGKYHVDFETNSTSNQNVIYQIVAVEDYSYDDSMAEDGIYFISGTLYSSKIDSDNYNVEMSDRFLTLTEDDYGNSYYFNGAVLDNYINFAGMCWRIVRIDGNGNIKIILADSLYECNSSNYKVINNNSYIGTIGGIVGGYDSSIETANYDSWIVSDIINDWIISKNIDVSKLESNGEWCNDISLKSIIYYDENWTQINDSNLATYNDLFFNASKTSFKCDYVGVNGSKPNKVISNSALLTAAEVNMAGGYLYTNAFGDESLRDVNSNLFGYLTMTPGSIEDSVSGYLKVYVYDPNNSGLFEYDYVTGEIRPALLLKKGTILKSGNGTQSNPYVIE